MTSSPFIKYASVILDVAIDKTLDYGITEAQLPLLTRGMRISVPVRGRLTRGYIAEIKDTPAVARVQPIAEILSAHELITTDLFELALWIAKYYHTPLRSVFKTMLPGIVRQDGKAKEQLFVMRGKTREQLCEICESLRQKDSAQADVLDVMLKVKTGILLSELLELADVSRSPVNTLAKKGYLVLENMRIDRSPLINEQYFQTEAKKLNPAQESALKKIVTTLDEKRFETHLLYGVTGSGKTEVYLQAIDNALKAGKGTIMLVPEISLTPQTIERFRSRFEGQIAVLHCRLSLGERFDEWHRIYRGDAKIIIGARSAVFSPVLNLGLIIVDEEHEQSYKQNDTEPCYHARDVAVMRAKMASCAVILGSATPCLESFYNTILGKYTLSTLHERADAANMPSVTIVDMKKEFEKAKGYTSFSEALLSQLDKRHSKGEQSILFLNRRGYHTTHLCSDCQEVSKCTQCDTALTFHKGANILACHLCGYTLSPPPRQCSHCGGETLKFRGVGTEQIEKALHAVLPSIRTTRIDGDTTRHKGSHERLFRDFRTGKSDVLIGTQMIAKGLHFPNVTLVGILNSDNSLNIPDFRASEQVFQLITQVAGRSGRGEIHGEVIIQTAMPENATILYASQQNFLGFYEEEIAIRSAFNYPPYTHMVKLTFSGENHQKTIDIATHFHQSLRPRIPEPYQLHPLAPSGHAKIKNRHRLQFIIRGPSVYFINRQVEAIQQGIHLPSGIHLNVDVDPLSTFF